jgi:putative endonuclease
VHSFVSFQRKTATTYSYFMATHNNLGKEGEQKALDYLLKLGHTLLAQNYRNGRDEVDIITRDGNFIVFTEVKTRSSDSFGLPEEFVNKKKRKAMKKVAEAFVSEQQLEADIRFDIVSVHHHNGELTLYHIPDAFFNEPGDKYN